MESILLLQPCSKADCCSSRKGRAIRIYRISGTPQSQTAVPSKGWRSLPNPVLLLSSLNLWEIVSSRAILSASIYAPDISNERGEPNGANITKRPFQEPGNSEPAHPEEDGEREPKTRLDYRQECIQNTPDRDRRCQLHTIMTASTIPDEQDSPLSQASELGCGCPGLVPPHDSGQNRSQPEPGERAHEDIAVLIIVLKRVKDAEAHEAHRGQQAHEKGHEARRLPPLGVIGQPVEVGRVPHMVDGKDGTGKAHPGDRAACNKHGLEVKGCNVTDKGYLWVDLAWVSGLAECQPPDEEDREGGEPGNACHEREDPKLVRIADVGPEDPGPESSCHACQSCLSQMRESLKKNV